MKISKRTLEILRNFSVINPSILIKPGNKLSTMAHSKKVLASAIIQESFDREFGVYELNKLLGVLSLLSDPEVTLTDSVMKIISDGHDLEYVYSAPETIVIPPEKEVTLPSEDAVFKLPWKTLSEVQKAAGVLGVSHLVMAGDGVKSTITAIDVKNPSSHSFKIDLGECESRFQAIFKSEVFKFLPMDYNVTYSEAGITRLEGEDVTYWIASEREKKNG